MKKLCLLFSAIVFLIVQIEIEAEMKNVEQKTFDEIFGQKWEEKEEKLIDQNENNLKRREIVEKFNKIKEKIKQKGKKYSTKEWKKIEQKIAKKLGTNRQYIYKWTKELNLHIYKSYKSKTAVQKIEIVKKFIAMKNEFKQKERKYSKKEWHQNYAEIGKKIGVSHATTMRWKKQFGLNGKRLTEKEKMDKMKMYRQIKIENPKMSDEKIAEFLQISGISIRRWKKQFGEEKKQNLKNTN